MKNFSRTVQINLLVVIEDSGFSDDDSIDVVSLTAGIQLFDQSVVVIPVLVAVATVNVTAADGRGGVMLVVTVV